MIIGKKIAKYSRPQILQNERGLQPVEEQRSAFFFMLLLNYYD